MLPNNLVSVISRNKIFSKNFQCMASQLAVALIEIRVSVTNLCSENNLLTFSSAINSNVCSYFFRFRPDYDWPGHSVETLASYPKSSW